MSRKNPVAKSGFTTIELLIVVAIIGILAAIIIPQMSSYKTRAYNAAALSDIRSFKHLIEAYYADNKTYPAI